MSEIRQPGGLSPNFRKHSQPLFAANICKIYDIRRAADICSRIRRHLQPHLQSLGHVQGCGHVQGFSGSRIFAAIFVVLGICSPFSGFSRQRLCSVCLNACNHINENPGSSSQKAGASVEV